MNAIRILTRTLCAAVLGFSIPTLATGADLEVAIAEYQSVERERLLDGVVEAVHHSTISSQVSARVTAIYFDVDDHVQQGTVIIEFDDTEYKARLQQAIAGKQAAVSHLDAARSQYVRIENLYRKGTVSKSEFDQNTANLGSAKAELASAEAVIIQLRQQLEYTRLSAPYSGIVTKRHIELGETANPGSPLMSGFSLDQLRVVVNIPQRLISAVEKHRRSRVLLPGKGKDSIKAEKITVFPYAQKSSGTIPVRVLLPEKTTGVYPGILVKVAFGMGNRLRLAIPEDALVYRSEVVGVYVVDRENRISFRHIRTGNAADDGTVEILAGLDDGEAVAMNPLLAAAQLKSQTRTDQP